MALNHCEIMGRITAPLELRSTASGKNVLSFTVAVDRGSDKQTDFIPVVAWEKTAEFINNYFDKGKMICIEGRIQTRNYEAPNGDKRFVTEVIAERVHFTGEKKENTNTSSSVSNTDEFVMSNDDDLPF